MKVHDQNKKVRRNDVQLTTTVINTTETNKQQHVLRKDVEVQTKPIRSKNVYVQTEQPKVKFNDEYTNDQRNSSHRDVDIQNDSLNKMNENEKRIKQIQDPTEVCSASIAKYRRVVETVSEKKFMARATSIISEITANVEPIIGYADEPLLPLYKACAPLIPIIHNLSFYVQMALDETPEHPPDGLTIDESAAIRLYTIEWDGSHRSLYSTLNNTLKKSTRENLRPYHKYLKLFLTALVKLPCVPHLTVWRGVTKNLSSEFLPGTEVTWWGFSSCTTEMTVLESNMYLGKSGSRTLFSVEAINGRTIRAHSHFVTEDEILLLPGTQMIVQSKFNPAADLHVIHLKQVEPEQILLEPPFENAHVYPKIARHWYRKKRFGIQICFFMVLIIAGIILGSVLGTRTKNTVAQATCRQPFGNSTSYKIGKNPVSSIMIGFGKDKPFGVAVANSGDNTVSVITYSGNGTFQTLGTYTVGRTPYSIASADFNTDGNMDLAVANANDNTVSILFAYGNETFSLTANYTVGHTPYSLISSDLNHDTYSDLAVANYADNTISILTGNTNGTFYLQASYTVGHGPCSLISTSLNDDIFPDLAVANYGDNSVSILYGNRDGTFSTPINVLVGNSPTCVTIIQLNNNKDTNLLVVNSGDNNVCILSTNVNGTFQMSICYAASPGAYYVIFGDFNNDLKIDLVVANKANNTVSVLLNSGGNTTSFETPLFYQVESKPTSLVPVDFNSDNQMDLLVTNEGSDDVSIFMNICK